MSVSTVQIRRGIPSDLAAIVALEMADTTAPHWPPATYAAILDAQLEERQPSSVMHRCLFVAGPMGTRIDTNTATETAIFTGFAVGLVPPPDEKGDRLAELESVLVVGSARRKGVGRALCMAVLDWCRESGATAMMLEVRASSASAIGLYTERGFLRAGLRPRYYRDPEEDALIFQRSLL